MLHRLTLCCGNTKHGPAGVETRPDWISLTGLRMQPSKSTEKFSLTRFLVRCTWTEETREKKDASCTSCNDLAHDTEPLFEESLIFWMKVQVCGCPCERRRCPFIPLCVTQCCYKHSAYDRGCAPSEHCEVISKKYKFNLSCWVTNGLFPHVCGQTWQPVLWYTLTKCSFTWHGTIAVIQGENEGFIYHRHTLSLYPVSVVSLYSDLSHFLCN